MPKVVRLREDTPFVMRLGIIDGMTGDKYRRLRKFRSQCHDCVAKSIAALRGF